jgi:hypothetical protein
VAQEIRDLEGKVAEIDKTIAGFCKELGIDAPFGMMEGVSNGAEASLSFFQWTWTETSLGEISHLLAAVLVMFSTMLTA